MPWIVFFWLVPGFSSLTIGNDYPVFSILAQIDILYSFKTGAFPLIVPGPENGVPVGGLTLGGLFHPQTYLSSIIPGFWDGKALQIVTVFRLLFLGIAHLALFRIFLKLKLSKIGAAMISSLPLYNLKALDSFRYGASFENYIGFIFVVCSVFFLRMRQLNREPVLISWYSLIISSYLLLVGGHPQWMFILFGGSLVVTLLVPSILNAFWEKPKSPTRPFWILTTAGFAISLTLASPYLLSFTIDFLSLNSTRGQMSYLETLQFGHTFSEMINIFFMPFKSEVHSSFSSSPLLFISLVLPPVAFLLKKRFPAPLLVLWFLVFFILSYTLGSLTPIHKLFYQLPFFGSFRVPGRFALLIPLFSSLILAWAFRSWTQMKEPIGIGSLVTLVATLAHRFFYSSGNQPRYSPYQIQRLSEQMNHYELVGALLISFFLIFLCWSGEKKSRLFSTTLFISLFAYCTLLLRFGTWTTPQSPSISFNQMKEQKRKGTRNAQSVWGHGMALHVVSEFKKRNRGLLPRLAYLSSSLSLTETGREALENFIGQKNPGHVFIPRSQLSQEIISALSAPMEAQAGTVSLERISYNQFRFKSTVSSPCFLVLGVPLGHHQWIASTPDSTLKVFDSNGGYPAVFLGGSGTWDITFSYESRAIEVGIIIALFTLLALISGTVGSQYRLPILVLGAVLCSFIFFAFKDSLYSGESWGTSYEWFLP